VLIELGGLDGRAVHRVMTQVILPRPIAWVVSENPPDAPDRWNLAPFSYFNGVASEPPLVMYAVSTGVTSAVKDTLANVTARPVHTIAIPRVAQLAAVQASAAELPPGASEFTAAGLDPVGWDWPVPRPAGSRVALGCTVARTIELPGGRQHLVLAAVDRVWVDDAAVEVGASGRIRIDPAVIDPLARLGAGTYAAVGPARRP
jgi:flavin reductase (DIM6/NTAB) family NADH-FMN oxidoreductase RutF